MGTAGFRKERWLKRMGNQPLELWTNTMQCNQDESDQTYIFLQTCLLLIGNMASHAGNPNPALFRQIRSPTPTGIPAASRSPWRASPLRTPRLLRGSTPNPKHPGA